MGSSQRLTGIGAGASIAPANPYASRTIGRGAGRNLASTGFSTGKLGQNTGKFGASVYESRGALREGAEKLVTSLRGFTSSAEPVFRTSISVTKAVSAAVGGLAARIGSLAVSAATLQANRAVNTQTSTIRSSASALGLDLVGRASRLSSRALSLDLSSAPAASTLTSSADLALDTTSPTAASRLQSAAALGLDLTSPDAASVLSSAGGLGLDVTAPEAVSRLQSAVLGLDLTSPEAASHLQSAQALGLDVTSPESASTLASSAALGLDVTSAQRASTIQSTSEIKSATTSYGSPTLIFAGTGTPSTSTGTLSGVYTGVNTAAAANSLTFTLNNNVTALNGVTASTVRFEVRDQAGRQLFSFNGSLKAGDKVYLGDDIGLSLSFGTGSLSSNQTAATTVSRSNTDVDPNGVFNDPDANARPRFDGSAQVTAGAFTVNGVSIAVNANDTINTVLARISASGAGVTAAFANDKVTLTSASNSEDAVVLGNDTSGFLSAVKLGSATTTRGNVRDDAQVLAKTTQFGGVTSGTFSLNGVTIAVNRDTDTLTSIIGRINGSAAGVTAAYDASRDALVLTGTASSEELVSVGNDTSGFLAAAKLASGNTVRGNIRDDRQVLSRTSQFAGVTSGSFSINGTTFSIDAATDSLNTVIGRINAGDAGVTAAYDAATDSLVLTRNSNSKELIAVDADSTGFLAAAHLSTGNTVRGHVAEDGVALRDLTRFSSVVDGSFVVGGKRIAVATTDSVQSIVDRINGADAGVTASFDAVSNTIGLTSIDSSEEDVAVGDDTSGFLGAAGLATANTARGNIRDDRQVLARTSQFGNVSSGSFTINGTAITVDAANDTLDTVLARINAAGAGVTAAYDADTDRLVLTGTENSQDLIAVANDSTGFLSSARLATTDTVRGHLREDGVALGNIAAFAAVTDGAFTIDGREISVDTATDTVTSLIDRINSSGARVVARYDGDADRITLQATYDSEDDVPLGSDTSGFLAAAHLAAANTVAGNLRDDRQVLARTTPFAAVVDGSFTVNGTTIDVVAQQDSVASVVEKINSSGAGVTASYDASARRIALVSTSASEDAIVVGQDTSGFLAAGHLSTDNTVRGSVRDDQQVLSKTSEFAAVVSGTFTVNGRQIDVDAASDSIGTILDRINAADAGVTASLDAATGRIALVGTADSEQAIAVGEDSSGFLAAAGLVATNTLRGNIADDRQVLSATTRFADVVSGSFSVNGKTITVDAGNDSLQDVLARVNAADAGVTATYAQDSDTVVFTPTVAGATLALQADTSGLLAAAGISGGVVGLRVNREAAFNAGGVNGPLFDPGLSVRAGQFTVNGVAIDVAADDSVDSVLAKITASSAGVKATFDSGSQTVRLASTDRSGALALAGDTSGFLAAVKLDADVTRSTGEQSVSAYDVALGSLPEYAGVRAGSVVVNGREIDIDPATTTMRGLVAAIGDTPGVRATLDQQTGRLQIASTRPDEAIVLSDSSGVLGALGITTGTYAGTPAETRTVTRQVGSKTVSNADKVATQVEGAVSAFNGVLSALPESNDRAAVAAAIERSLTALHNAGIQGLALGTERGQLALTLDRRRLESSLGSQGGNHAGLAPGAQEALDDLLQDLSVATGAAEASGRGVQVASAFQLAGPAGTPSDQPEVVANHPLLDDRGAQSNGPGEGDAAARKEAALALLKTLAAAQQNSGDVSVIKATLGALRPPATSTIARAIAAYNKALGVPASARPNTGLGLLRDDERILFDRDRSPLSRTKFSF